MSYLESDEQERKLFIGGLNKRQTDEDRLRKYFLEFGKIIDVTIMRDADKQSRGFGFVLFESAASVDVIIGQKKAGNSFELDDHHIEVKRALPKVPGGNAGAARTDGLYCKVFVGGLPSTINEEDLRTHFEVFGKVCEVDLLRDRETNRLRGFAFVTFEEEDSADKCIQRRTQEICKKMCEVKRAQTRSTLTKYNDSEDRHHRREEYYDRNSHHNRGNAPHGNNGMMSMPEVNQLIQQAYVMGQQSVLQNSGQMPTAATLLGLGGVNSYNAPPVNNTLLQALINQQQQPAALPAPIAPPTQNIAASNANATTINQIAQLLNGKGIDPGALTALLKQDDNSRASSKTSNSGRYSTAYPTSSSYDMYYNNQNSGYGPAKDEIEKRVSYRPY